MPSSIITISNLQYQYPTSTKLQGHTQTLFCLRDLTMNEGETVFLSGPSGTGKSTLLNLIAGIWQPSSGGLTVCGQELSQLGGAQRDAFRAKNIGVISQKLNLLPYLTAAENVQIAGFFSASKVAALNTESLLNSLNISPDLFNQPVSQLSVGQQQRVAIARAFVNKPKLIIADEPTSALDETNANSFVDILFEYAIAQRVAVLFVSHDKKWQDRFDRVLHIEKLAQLQRSESC